jgi:syntaxin-binding protein 5
MCHSAAVTHFDLHGYALVGVFGDATTRAYSLPGLRELGRAPLSQLDPSRIHSTIVTPTGDIFGWSSPSELAFLSVWGTGEGLRPSQDVVFDVERQIPPRPTISNLQWISGTQYVSPTDLDILIGGPDRPPSKRMLAAAAEEDRAQRSQRAGGYGAGPSSTSRVEGELRQAEGWGDYMARQLNERTEKLGIMGDGMDRVEQNSKGWAEDASSWANKQKRNILFKGVAGKFF